MGKATPIDLEKDLLLSHFTLENLHEGVFWVDSSAGIFQVNDMACQMTGYSREELTSMKIQNLNQSSSLTDFPRFWKNLKKEKKIISEVRHKHKEGFFYDVEVTDNYIEFDGKEFACTIVRDMRKKRMEEELLRSVSEATSGKVGQDFFEALTENITSVLNVKTCLITECLDVEKTRLRTLSYTINRQLVKNIEYDVAGTPCELVMRGKGAEVFIPSGCEKTYPKEAGYESYIAVPIYSPNSGELTGHIAVFSDVQMTESQNQASILKIFAARAGSEIDRIKAEKKLEETLKSANVQLQIKLKESEERYRDLFEEAPIAYVHEGLDSKFIRANKTALKILGVKPEEVPEMYGVSLIPDTPEAQRRVKEALESIGRGTDTSGVVLELRRKDTGEPIFIQWWSRPDPSGQFTRTMFIDITRQVMMEQEQARLKAQNQYLQEEIKLNHNFDEIISKSKDFHKVLMQVEQVASTNATVLILGESGTGKELIARALHNISNRSKRPLIKVNCAALPANLIESELFGHEKGAFTGATEKKIGRFELADGGTIFLDEIGDLPVDLQAKLLRVLQEGEFERLGNSKTMKVDVRVIAATNRNLEQAIEKKEFREDLYYRLNVFPLVSPPLRDRKEDIPLLVNHFCKKYEHKIGRKINNIPQSAIDRLMSYDWPGNIRELENIIERALILSANDVLEIGDWLPQKTGNNKSYGEKNLIRLEDVEKEHIISVLEQTGWKVSGDKGAAKILGLNPTTLEARMKKLGITRKK